jgi:hypothetical protein
MKAEDSKYRLPKPKFHISLEHSMNRVAVRQPGLAAAALYCGAPSADLGIPGRRTGRERAGINPGEDDGERDCRGAAIITIGMSDAEIEQSQEAMRLTVKMTSTIGKAAQPGPSQPCSMGTSLDSFQFGRPLTL